MEWRCEWCGTPHEEDDPPCDNCGHGSFERAVVPTAEVDDEGQEKAIVWVCTDCGREHPKNSPPCSRCGNPDLEQSRLEIDDEEFDVPSYLDLVTPRYLLAAAVVFLFAGLIGFGLLGIGPLSGISGEVPGDPDEINGQSLADAEATYLDELNDRREAGGASELERSEELDEVAAVINEEWIRVQYENGDIDQSRIENAIRGACDGEAESDIFDVPASSVGDEPGRAMIEYRLDPDEAGITTVDADTIGIDAHAGPNGRLHVVQVVCWS